MNCQGHTLRGSKAQSTAQRHSTSTSIQDLDVEVIEADGSILAEEKLGPFTSTPAAFLHLHTDDNNDYMQTLHEKTCNYAPAILHILQW